MTKHENFVYFWAQNGLWGPYCTYILGLWSLSFTHQQKEPQWALKSSFKCIQQKIFTKIDGKRDIDILLLCTFTPNIGKIGWKLREPIRFEKKMRDKRTTDGSALDKLRWLCQQRNFKRNTNKWGHPLSWLVIGDGDSTSVLFTKYSNYLTSSLTETGAAYCNNNQTRRK